MNLRDLLTCRHYLSNSYDMHFASRVSFMAAVLQIFKMTGSHAASRVCLICEASRCRVLGHKPLKKA